LTKVTLWPPEVKEWFYRSRPSRMHGSACNGGFGRCASKKAGMKVKKVCEVDFHQKKIKILKILKISKILKNIFKIFDFCFLFRFYALHRVKKYITFTPKILIVYSLEAFEKWHWFRYSNGTRLSTFYRIWAPLNCACAAQWMMTDETNYRFKKYFSYYFWIGDVNDNLPHLSSFSEYVQSESIQLSAQCTFYTY